MGGWVFHHFGYIHTIIHVKSVTVVCAYVFKSSPAMQMVLKNECKQTMLGCASAANLNEFIRAYTHTFAAYNVYLILCIISIETNL